MKNILVVFTGGTIGSTAIGGTINTSNAAPYKLIQLFQQHASHEQIRFHSIQPIQILSENLAPVVWEKLIAAIEAEDPGHYDGIIITHGTDTLAFTAAALGLYFNALAIPVLLVSSDRPLDDPEANGLPNFICAVEFILQRREAGVFAPYTNRNQTTTQVHRGTRLASSLQLSGDFMSVQGKSHCRFVNGAFTENSLIDTKKPRQPVPLKADFSHRILLIKPYPGLDYRHVNLDAADAVLHDLYHSGTACSSAQWGDQFSLLTFIKQCRERGIKVYLAPAVKSDNAYESTRELLQAGAQMLWNLSLEAAYVKLLLAYGNFSDEQQITDFIDQDIAGEHVQTGLAL